MKNILLLIGFNIFCSSVLAQVSEVKEQVNDSYEYYQDAFRKIKNAKYYINSAFEASTLDDVQSYASSAESELSSAKTYTGYAEDEADDAEDEASSLNCDDAEDSASNAEDYFYAAKNKLNYAISELSNASYEDDIDFLSNYLNNANSYISQALTQMSYGVDELNETLKEINNCGVPAETSYYSSSSNTPSCEDLMEYIKDNGYSKGTLSNYTMDSEWLYEVKAYTYEYKTYVIAKIKKNEYSYTTTSYVFCDIPSTNWSNFKYGAYGDSDSYGERFHKYIMNYKCDCY